MANRDVEVRIHGKDELSKTLRSVKDRLGSLASQAKIAFAYFTAEKITKFFKDALKASIAADSGMSAAAGRIKTAWTNLQVGVGKSILGNAGVVNALESLLKAATPVVTFLTGALGKAFLGLQILVIDLVAQFKKIPYELQDIAGAAKELWGGIVTLAGKGGRLFGRLTGTDIGQDTLAKGRALVAEGRAQRQFASDAERILQSDADQRKGDIIRASQTSTASGTPGPKKGGAKDRTPDFGTVQLEQVGFRAGDDQAGRLKAAGFDDATILQLQQEQQRDRQNRRVDIASSLASGGADVDIKRLDFHAEQVDQVIKPVSELTEHLRELREEGIGGLGQAFADAFYAAGAGADKLGAATVKSVKMMISQIASMEGQLQFAKGTEKLAEGIWPPNPLALKSAATHFAAGALFMTLAGALGGGGGAGGTGGGGAGGTGGLGSDQFGQDQRGLRGDADATIVLDYLNLEDPRREERLRKDLERLSGKRVKIAYSSGRGG